MFNEIVILVNVLFTEYRPSTAAVYIEKLERYVALAAKMKYLYVRFNSIFIGILAPSRLVFDTNLVFVSQQPT